MREIGVVNWFNIEKGFGFISRINEHEDIFVHITQLLCRGTSMIEGVFVTYNLSGEKKKEAKKVKLLKDEDDYEILEKAFFSDRNGIWQYGFKKFLPMVKEPDERIIYRIMNKLDNFKNSSALTEYIPEHFFLYTDKLNKYLSVTKKIKILVNKIQESTDIENDLDNVDEIVRMLKSDENNKSWDLIPDVLLARFSSLMQIAPKERIYTYFITLLVEENNKIIPLDFLNFLKRNPTFVQRIPQEHISKDEQLFCLLPPRRQVDIAWPEIEDKWDILSAEAKVLSIYRSAKEKEKVNRIMDQLKNQKESNLLVRALIFILSTKIYKDHYIKRGINPFNKAHSMIQEFFIRENNIEGQIINNIFPECNHHLTFLCEGRKWFDSDSKEFKKNSSGSELAFCPRKAGPCEIGDFGARIYSNINKEWWNWTLAELMDSCGMNPILPELNDNDVYILKLSGWVNRLIEIRDRMKCSKCKGIMLADFKYAKNLAVYNSTVAECKHCQEKVYLTHCWACHNIIDSRESCFQVEGIYICIHCGSGPKKSETYSQGDYCPKCNTSNMQDADYRNKICTSCNHRIRLPLEKYLTGHAHETRFHFYN